MPVKFSAEKYVFVFLRLLAAFGLIGLNWLLGRYWGIDYVGLVSTVLSLVLIAASLSRLGLDALAIRVVGSKMDLTYSRQARRYLPMSVAVVLTSSAIIALCFSAFSQFSGAGTWIPRELISLGWGGYFSLALPVFAFAIAPVGASVLRATKHPALTPILEVGGGAWFIGLVAFVSWAIGAALSAFDLLFYGALLFLIFSAVIVIRKIGFPSTTEIKRGSCLLVRNFSSAIRLTGVAVVQATQLWIFVPMAMFFHGSESAGELAVGSRLGMSLFVILGIYGGLRGPVYAAMFRRGEFSAIWALERQTKLALSLVTVPSVVLVFLFGDYIVRAFGMESRSAYFVLLILFSAQAINVVGGCCTHMLVGCGFERVVFLVTVVFFASSFALAAILGSIYGVEGVALGQSLGVAGPALAANFFARKFVCKG